ncbi:MAG: hypothetical protein QF886_22575, partial [Planctomycetota bacterium]|nr:hypothetical protein [Planctomycetota bacterium]
MSLWKGGVTKGCAINRSTKGHFMRPILMAIMMLLAPTGAEEPGPGRRKARPAPAPRFVYDQADHTTKAVMLEGEELYDPGVASKGDELWMTWLKF